MKSASGSAARLSRRAFVGAAVASFGFVALPPGLRAGAAEGAPIQALAFDGDALLVARPTLSRREDGGASWRSEPAPDAGAILALATHPDRPGRIIAGMTTGGVAVSEDGGRSWKARSGGLLGGAVTAVTAAATQPDTLYAAVRGDGLWQSEDAGRSWAFVMDRPWLADTERDPMALTSVNLATGMGGIWIYAGTEVGLTRVPDCFCRWQDVQPGDAMEALASGAQPAPEAPLPVGEPIRALVSAPSAPETLYAALRSGVWASQDAGVAWSRVTAWARRGGCRASDRRQPHRRRHRRRPHAEPRRRHNLDGPRGRMMEITMKSSFAIATVLAIAAAGGIAFATLSSAQDTGSGAAVTGASAAAAETRAITIWRDPGCGCCDAYAEYLEANGYKVTRVDDPDFDKRSVAAGVPAQGLGCHLAEIDGYYVSGLVPAEIIERLVTERPKITGITLPGMPGNAPGMAPQKTGTLKTYAFEEDGVSVYTDE